MGKMLLFVVLLLMNSLWATSPVQNDEEDEAAVFRQALADNPDTGLLMCAKIGLNVGVAWCLGNGAEINTRKNNGRTALMIAAKYGHEHTIQFLLKFGADMHTVDNVGNTALMLAGQNGHSHIVQRLCEAGVQKYIIEQKARRWCCWRSR